MNPKPSKEAAFNFQELAEKIKLWGIELGFNEIGIADLDLSVHEDYLKQWLDNRYHGEMEYMSRHGMMRARPAELHPGTIRVICARMDYLPNEAKFARILENKDKAYISRYALGRDYHKVIRKRLKSLGEKIKTYCHDLDYRPFVDSAPILERPLAAKAGLGWIGKHSLLLNETAGSWFFLGELLVNIPLPVDKPVSEQCGGCTACLKICPTEAIVAPYTVDSRRCISYLTIELKGAIPESLRSMMGNRIYGCDDCQLVCPWNQYATPSSEHDFQARHDLDDSELLTLFQWDEQTFKINTAGSAIYRIGYERWQRNISVALGNADFSVQILEALKNKICNSSELVKEHIEWAIKQQESKHKVEAQNTSGQTSKLIRTVYKVLSRDA